MQAKINKTAIFLQNLRFLVNKTGLKDFQVAEALGLHKVSFSRYFTEGRIPKRTVLEKMSVYFGVSVDDLLNSEMSEAVELAPSKTDAPQITSAEFEAFVIERTEILQKQVNAFAVEMLEMLSRVKR